MKCALIMTVLDCQTHNYSRLLLFWFLPPKPQSEFSDIANRKEVRAVTFLDLQNTLLEVICLISTFKASMCRFRIVEEQSRQKY